MSGANFTPENIRDDDDSRVHRSKTRNNFNYVALALNAIQKYFADALQEVSDRIIKPAIRGGFNVNDIRYFGTAEKVVANIPTASSQTVYVTTAISILNNLTVPSNISLVVPKGGSFAIASGKTLTINGSFDGQGNTLADLFSGSGSYAFGKAVRLVGTGTPQAVVTAPVGSEFLRTDGSTGTTIYIKESGTGNTGWGVPGSGVTGSGTSGQVTYWSGTSTIVGSTQFTFTNGSAGVPTTLGIKNSSSAAGSDSSFYIVAGGTPGGDPQIVFDPNDGEGGMSIGVDNSDSNTFKLVQGFSVSNPTVRLAITTAGIVTLPTTTDATSTTTGTLIVSGGVGIAKTLWVGDVLWMTKSVVNGYHNAFLNNTAASGASTGALFVVEASAVSTGAAGISFIGGTSTYTVGSDSTGGFVIGQSSTIGATAKFSIAATTGVTTISNLAGTGTRLVQADSAGLLTATALATNLPHVLTTSTTSAGNTLTGEDDLMTYSVPANTLATDGDSLNITAAGTFALATVRLRAYFGADLLFDTGSLILGATADWGIECDIIRTGATTQKAIVRFTSSVAALLATCDYTTPGRTLSSANTFKLTGEATLTNDVVQEMMKVRFEPAS